MSGSCRSVQVSPSLMDVHDTDARSLLSAPQVELSNLWKGLLGALNSIKPEGAPYPSPA